MTRSDDLLRLVPDAPDTLLDMPDSARGAVEPPIGRDLRPRALRSARSQPGQDTPGGADQAAIRRVLSAPGRQHPHAARGAALHRHAGTHRIPGQPGGRVAARQLSPDRRPARGDPRRPAAALFSRPAGADRRAAARPAAARGRTAGAPQRPLRVRGRADPDGADARRRHRRRRRLHPLAARRGPRRTDAPARPARARGAAVESAAAPRCPRIWPRWPAAASRW